MKKIRIVKDSGLTIRPHEKKYFGWPQDVFLKTFFPQDCSYNIVDENEKADIACYGIGLKDDSVLRDDELNVYIGIENAKFWGPGGGGKDIFTNHCYYFFIRYNYFNSKKTNVFIHNDKNIETFSPHRCIPAVHCRIQYYNNMREYYKKSISEVPFEKKKLILFISQNGLNQNKINLANFLIQNKHQSDHISQYSNFLKNSSCYHSKELLTLFSNYKFIACFENSSTPGYITEKIFNVFFSKSIPIYDGAPDLQNFINPKSYIRLDSNILRNIEIIGNNKELYNEMLNSKKIQPKYENIKIEF